MIGQGLSGIRAQMGMRQLVLNFRRLLLPMSPEQTQNTGEN